MSVTYSGLRYIFLRLENQRVLGTMHVEGGGIKGGGEFSGSRYQLMNLIFRTTYIYSKYKAFVDNKTKA